MRYGGNRTVQILGHKLKHWLLQDHDKLSCMDGLASQIKLELSRHVLPNIAHFRLRAHNLRVEPGCWQIHKKLCDKCDLHDVQDETIPLIHAPA